MQFLGKDIRNVEMFNEGLIANWTELYHKYSGTSFEAKNGDTLHYYKEPNYLGEEGDIFRLAFIHTADGTLYQLGVVKEPYLLIDSEVFAEAHKNALTTIKAENPPVDSPKDEVPTPDQPTKEVEEPKEEEPKPEEPKPEEPDPEKPKEEELPEANRGEDVFLRDGKYFVKRFDENGNAIEVFVKKTTNPFDAETGAMILEDAPEGVEIFSVDGRYYYIDKVADKPVYVKGPKEEPKPEEPKESETPEEPKEEEPKHDEPEVPEQPKPEEPKEEPEKPVEEPKGPESLLNGVKIVINNDLDYLAVQALEGKKFTISEDGKLRIYELLKALNAGEISVDVFFHEIETGFLTQKAVEGVNNSNDLLAIREAIEEVIKTFIKDMNTPR
jgi:hypothetical protein|nr:MAG TPA: hypothetical protein [Caudoviricetes sp.]